jgi:hypothetical protein
MFKITEPTEVVRADILEIQETLEVIIMPLVVQEPIPELTVLVVVVLIADQEVVLLAEVAVVLILRHAVVVLAEVVQGLAVAVQGHLVLVQDLVAVVRDHLALEDNIFSILKITFNLNQLLSIHCGQIHKKLNLYQRL